VVVASAGRAREAWVSYVALSWGFCAYFPVGLMYLHLLVMLVALGVSANLADRMRCLRQTPFVAPIACLLAWTVLVVLVGDWYPDTGTRLFHIGRVSLVLCLALMLTPTEARMAFGGFMLGSIVAALIVALHHVVGLPDWAIWKSLLSVRGNFSSGNMITMATASGILFFLAMRRKADARERWLALLAALALGATVAFHSVSRNSQLLLVLLAMASVLYRFRTLQASVAGVLLALALGGALWQFSPNIQTRFAEVGRNLQAAESDGNYSTGVGVRWRMYQEAIAGMAESPVFGTGLGSWLPRWRSVAKPLDKGLDPDAPNRFSEVNNPHNEFLLAGMETGVVGMLLVVWLLSLFVVNAWQRQSTFGGITLVMGTSLVMTALVNAPLRDAALGMTLLWLLGASAAGRRKARRA